MRERSRTFYENGRKGRDFTMTMAFSGIVVVVGIIIVCVIIAVVAYAARRH